MKILPLPEPVVSAFPDRRAIGYGIIWDPEWVAAGRLRVRGYRAVNAMSAVTRADFDALVVTTDDALESAGWTEFERHAVRVVLERLYAADLAGWPRMDVISPGTPPSLDLSPALVRSARDAAASLAASGRGVT